MNSFYVYDVIETSKEILAGLKMMLTFLSRTTSPPSFTISIKVTLQYSSYFCLKNITKICNVTIIMIIIILLLCYYYYILILLPILLISCNILHKASNLCQTLSKNRNCSIFTKNVEKRWQYFGDMNFGNR